MRRRRRQVQRTSLQQQESKIFFKIENEHLYHCTICFKLAENPIKPCACSTNYHDSCLLQLIQRKILRELREKQEMDISTLKCVNCNQRFYLHFEHQTYRSCEILCQRLSDNCCSKYIILLLILSVILIVTVVVCFYFLSEGINNNAKLKYGLISASVVQVLVLVMLIYLCLESHLTVKRCVMYKVFDMTDPEVRSMESQNSDENKISQQQQIIIRK